MTRRKPVIAREHISELVNDSAHQEMLARKRAQLAAFAAEFADEEMTIAAEAKALGYGVTSVWDFVNNVPHPVLERPFVGPYDRAYPMLVRHLQLAHHPRVREGIIRALTVGDGGELVWNALYVQFTQESSPALKWVLANALKTAMPYRKRVKFPEIAYFFKSGGTA